jgi:isovaleryl-CoA dehydrogenase
MIDQEIQELVKKTKKICETVIKPLAQKTDQKCQWPKQQLKMLGNAGLLGLHVPKELGGLGQGLTALTAISETIGQSCSSTAMCYVMHCVGTAVITAKATEVQKKKYLQPIAKGNHITSLALSERGTGSHFYFPETRLSKKGKFFMLNGEKDFITNGGFADSYVLNTQTSKPSLGEFNCLILDANSPNMEWGREWRGFGLRGNSSRSLTMKNVRISEQNLLGKEGDEVWYVFQVVAPYFLVAISGVYLGIAQQALDLTINHVKARKFTHSGKMVADEIAIQNKIAEMYQRVQRSRTLLYHACELGDIGDQDAIKSIAMARVDANDAAIFVTNEAMTMTGGRAYAENSELSRLLRDARASAVMAPTPGISKNWIGRLLLGLPMLGE